jgi:hypothetical protein
MYGLVITQNLHDLYSHHVRCPNDNERLSLSESGLIRARFTLGHTHAIEGPYQTARNRAERRVGDGGS